MLVKPGRMFLACYFSFTNSSNYQKPRDIKAKKKNISLAGMSLFSEIFLFFELSLSAG
jgi:NADH:ubiquinone oxidoreductase subunit 6 (subunit J)